MPQRFDLIVAGAGPAGSAAALAALRRRPGARVLLLDRAAPGRDKVCGDGIAPHAVPVLRGLRAAGALLPAERVDAVHLAGVRGDGARGSAGAGSVVPRAVFDERLLNAAIAAGARFERHRVARVRDDGGEVVVDDRFAAPLLVAADGANSVVRRAVGQPANTGTALAVALRGYAPTPAGVPRELLIRWDVERAGGLCYAWAFPTADGRSNVGYGMSTSALRGGRAELEDRLHMLLPEYDLEGVALTGHTLPLSTRRPRAAVGRVLLTGDAASLVSPLTGEGIYSALVSGAAAGAAAVLTPGSAGRRYAGFLRRRFGRQHAQLRLLAPLLDSSKFLERAIAACAADPVLFARVLDVGLGDRAFSAGDLARLARGRLRLGLDPARFDPSRRGRSTAA